MLLNDSIINMGSLQTEKAFGYLTKRDPSRELPYLNNFHNSITYEMSLDQTKYFRRVYGILDFLADMGGLFGAISPVCFSIVMLF